MRKKPYVGGRLQTNPLLPLIEQVWPCPPAHKTIARAHAGGETALTVHCLGHGCNHQAVKRRSSGVIGHM
jgi:hypothetical protein